MFPVLVSRLSCLIDCGWVLVLDLLYSFETWRFAFMLHFLWVVALVRLVWFTELGVLRLAGGLVGFAILDCWFVWKLLFLFVFCGLDYMILCFGLCLVGFLGLIGLWGGLMFIRY